MGLPDSVMQKMERARTHFEELSRRLDEYYRSDPGQILETELSTEARRHFVYRERIPVSPQIPLIIGDCLQCLRSTLDYLIWELVIAAGNEPKDSNSFPIALKEKAYKNEIGKRFRLDGVCEEVLPIIDSLQPFKQAIPHSAPLAVLDNLTNINKHRRVLLTTLSGSDAIPDLNFPHMEIIARIVKPGGEIIKDIPFWGYLAFNEGFAKGIDVTVTVDSLARYIADEVFSPFEKFLNDLN
jgi:hypothetical protein